jgi:hypothetical protein
VSSQGTGSEIARVRERLRQFEELIKRDPEGARKRILERLRDPEVIAKYNQHCAERDARLKELERERTEIERRWEEIRQRRKWSVAESAVKADLTM